jgi:hypothetical protein
MITAVTEETEHLLAASMRRQCMKMFIAKKHGMVSRDIIKIGFDK